MKVCYTRVFIFGFRENFVLTMATRIDELKNGNTEKVHVLEVKIVKKVTEDYYIVADETAHPTCVKSKSERGFCLQVNQTKL